MAPRQRERRQSAARRRAETHSTGFETTMIRIPEGLSFFETEAGIRTVDVIPFIAGKGNPFADQGELYYERTFFCWRRIGAEEKSYCCLHKNWQERDPVQEWKNAEAKNPNADQKYLKDLSPKERQLFLVVDHKEPEKIQLWDVSHHLFGKLLDSRIKNSDERMGWDQFYFADEDGMSLRLTFEEQSGGGYTWLDVTAIDFVPRDEPLPTKIVEHGICLDDLLVKPSYQELRTVFLGVDADEEGASPARKTEEKAETKKEETKKEEPKRETRREEPKEEKKPVSKTAQELGLKLQDEVIYQKVVCTIAKISPDGLLLTLMTANDDLHKNVDPGSVKLLESVPEPKKEEPKRETKTETKTETKKEETKKAEVEDDDDWDFDK